MVARSGTQLMGRIQQEVVGERKSHDPVRRASLRSYFIFEKLKVIGTS